MSDQNTTTRRPTIYDVADRAGVSKSLVSLVLGGSPKVSENRRAAVLSAITELGYQPSRAATMLAGTRTRSIEVLIDEYRNLSFVGLVEGIRRALEAESFYLTVTEIRHQGGAAADSAHSAVTPADGRVLAAEPTPGVLAGWRNCPIVVAGHRHSIPDGADLVASDDELGGRLAVEHLVSLGHRHIAHLTGSGGAAVLRRAGYLGAVDGAGLPMVISGDGGGTLEPDGYHATKDVLTRHPQTTAVFAANDLMALGALAAIREKGLTVPDDVSVVGYDDSPLGQSRYLSLTTVDDRSVDVGAAAARALLHRIAEPQAPRVQSLIDPRLIVRKTTAAAR